MKKPVLLLFCVTLLLLAGCAAEQIQAPTASSTPVPPSSTPAPPSPTPSKTSFWRIVTSTITPPITKTLTPSNTPVPTHTSTPPPIPIEAQNTIHCLEILPELPDSAEASGVVVLMKDRKIYLLDMTTQQLTKMSLPNEKPYDFKVSPNRNFIAIDNILLDDEGRVSGQELVIADASGQRLKSIPWEENWRSLLGWKDDQHVLLSVDFDRNNYSLLEIDPFNDERQRIELHNIAPGWGEYIKTYAPTGIWPGFASLLLDPTYTMSIYPQDIEGDPTHYTYRLWNIAEQRLVLNLESIVKMDNFFYYYPLPAWSPDNAQFALGGIEWYLDKGYKSELFVITRDGQVKQMTNLANFDDEIIATYPSWSPDGRYIAFYLVPDGIGTSRLAVLDTKSLKLIDYCIPLDVLSAGIPNPPVPLWSPDSKQLLLLDTNYETQLNRVLWVSPGQGLAAQVAEDIDLVQWFITGGMWGWMAAPEE
ncbi:MAG: PD40 domain-containing protein [Anaerolineales bacterium]|nr:PD40 domain-containing protein [Anaerolineales bacterium]